MYKLIILIKFRYEVNNCYYGSCVISLINDTDETQIIVLEEKKIEI